MNFPLNRKHLVGTSARNFTADELRQVGRDAAAAAGMTSEQMLKEHILKQEAELFHSELKQALTTGAISIDSLIQAAERAGTYILSDGRPLQFISRDEAGNMVPGVTNEELLTVLIDRTTQLQESLPCEENEFALACMSLALGAFNRRTSKREEQGVEQTDQPHVSAAFKKAQQMLVTARTSLIAADKKEGVYASLPSMSIQSRLALTARLISKLGADIQSRLDPSADWHCTTLYSKTRPYNSEVGSGMPVNGAAITHFEVWRDHKNRAILVALFDDLRIAAMNDAWLAEGFKNNYDPFAQHVTLAYNVDDLEGSQLIETLNYSLVDSPILIDFAGETAEDLD